MSAVMDMWSTEAAGEMMSLLVGREVSVALAPPMVLARAPAWIGVYETREGDLGGLFLADLPFAVYASSALSLVPASESASVLEQRFLPVALEDNLAEIFNVSSRLFSRPSVPRAKYTQTVCYPTRLSAAWLDCLLRPGKRVDFEANIHGYGAGYMTLILP